MKVCVEIIIILSIKLTLNRFLIEANNGGDINRELFLDFLKIQNENCGTEQICTVRNESRADNGITFDQTERSCCLTCFCNNHCKNNETCCPENVISSDQYGDISKYTNVYEHTISYLSPKLDGNNTMKSCISSRLINRDTTYGLNGIREAYLAVTRCPTSYKNDVIKSKCKDVTAEESTSIDDLLPVTSMSTNYSYRNIFCLQCHDKLDSDYIMWRTFLVCSSKEIVQSFIQPPAHLYKSIVSKSYQYCNIAFKPPAEVQYSVEDCFQTDIHSCETNRGNADSTVSSVYEEICRMYLLPVITTQKRSFTVYRNIACYLCNNNETLPDTCYTMYPDYTEYHLEINMTNTTQSPSSRNISSLDYIHQQYGDKCRLGYIHDKNMERCRKVLCPRHFYIHNGSCVPIISRMEGVFFNLIVEITPNGIIPWSSSFLEQYESQLDRLLEKEVNLLFKLLQINIWRKMSKSKLVVNVVSVNFKHEQLTYSEIIEKSRIMLSKIDDIEIKVNSRVIPVDAELSDNLYEINRFNRAIERETGSNLQNVGDFTRLKVEENKFILSKGHFCYRIELNSSEFVRFRKNVYKILHTGVRVEGEYFDATEEGNQIACIDDVIDVKDKDQNEIQESIVTENNDLFVILIFGVVVALIVIIAAARVICCCRNNET